MIKWVFLIGAALVALGIGGYVVTGMQSLTALIPAIPGVLLLVLGFVATRGDAARKHAMHVAAAVGMLTLLGTGPMSVPRLISWMGGTRPGKPAAVVSQSVTALLCLILVVLAVRSFIAARRARAGSGGAGV